MSSFAVDAENLRKRYGDKNALDGFNLTVQQGTVCGLLGPNGAGKTTAVRILSTLIKLDEGRATVGGYDVATEAAQVRGRIGLVGQNAAVDEVLSGFQNLLMFGRLYHLGAKAARVRAGEMLDRFGLAGTGNKPVKAYSGGMRRRLDLAAGMMLAPVVLLLDEPTGPGRVPAFVDHAERPADGRGLADRAAADLLSVVGQRFPQPRQMTG